MPDASPLQVLFLTDGDGPPPAVVALAASEEVSLEGRGVEAFLRGLATGGELPDALLVAGGASLIARLRQEPPVALLPLFLWGPPAPAPAGADGVVLHLDAATRTEIERWRRRLGGGFANPAADEEAPREASFRAWIRSRGQGRQVDAVAFGLTAARTTLRRAAEEGWLQEPKRREDPWLLRARPAPAPSAPTPTPVPVAAAVTLVPPAEETPLPPPRRRWVLPTAGVAAAAALLWWWAPWKLPAAPPEEPLAQGESRQEVLEAGFRPAPPPEEPASRPELVRDGRLRWELTGLHAPGGGSFEQWERDSGSLVAAGEVVAWWRPATDSQELARRTVVLEEAERGLAEALAAAREEHEARGRDLRAARDEAQAAESRLAARRPALAEAYEQARALADQGILAYRDIRAEWEALQTLDEAQADHRREVARLEEELAAWEAEVFDESSAAPGLRAQVASLRAQRDDTLGGPAREALLAPVDGRLLHQVAAGDTLAAGQLLLQLQVEEHARVEVVLPTEAWHADYLAGSARLRRQGDPGPWMPTRIEEAVSRPDGSTLLSLRLPVGWLALDPEQHAGEAWALECRLTAPVAARAEEGQPSGGVRVESQ
ncbi:MAG: hypothetical protein ACYTF3_02640 [Planctomycetota bacterium]|jgi:hypothetical protein